MVNMQQKEGRPELVPELHSMIHKDHCNTFNRTNVWVINRTKNKRNETPTEKCSSTKTSINHVQALKIV